jgi:exosortase A-associated hydrolase 1
MGAPMRRALSFSCNGATLAATLDEATGTSGLLIVSGGNEIRIGAHRGMAALAGVIAADGHPVFRFDRRGIGDSDGVNGGFESSGPDIEAALSAFRRACPALNRIVAFGNCDAASALVLHRIAVDARLLANPWVIAPTDDLPPRAAIRDRYQRRLRDPAAWAALLTGKINIGGLARGLGRLARATPAEDADDDALATRFARAMVALPVPTTIMLAARDATAVAFADMWRNPRCDQARDHAALITIDSASHSFADTNDFTQLVSALGRLLPG